VSDGGLHLDTVWNFAAALLIGALIGIEREKHKREGQHEGSIGGLRTFILFALVGALGAWLTDRFNFPWLLVAALFAVLAPIVASYQIAARHDADALGLTTELAAIATTLLGALAALGYRELAAALGVAVATILAYKQPLHGIVDRLDREDIYAGLRLSIATFIVLPLLPNRTVDPWEALNPWSLWLLVLLISGLSLVGYVATRLLGTHRGIALTGLTGGLVSSTAVTLAFARQSRDKAYAKAAYALATGTLIAWTVMFGRVLIAVAIVNRALLRPLLPPMIAMAVVAGALAWYAHRKAPDAEAQDVPLRNPFSLTSAMKFAALFAAVLLLVKLAQTYTSSAGIYAVAALAGTTDVDAITLSMAQYARANSPVVAAQAIVIATLSNTIVKAGMVATLGAASLRGPIIVASALIVAAGAAVMWLF
jgi:uncharacterized membrane protein (DUF4010 family)